MGDRSRRITELVKRVEALETQLEEAELSLFQAVVKLEALTKLVTEKEYISYDELEDYMQQVLEYYQQRASDEIKDSNDNESNSGGKLNIEVVKEQDYSIQAE